MNGKVLFIVPLGPILEGYQLSVDASLMQQTRPDWELMLVMDGEDTWFDRPWNPWKDSRIRYTGISGRGRDFGHSPRSWGLLNFPSTAEYIVLTGADNYYTPRFCEYMVGAFSPETTAVYCDFVSRFGEDGLPPLHPGPRVARWDVIRSRLERGHIDCGAVMIRADRARSVGYPSRDYAADWHYIKALVDRYGAETFRKVEQVLYVHN